MQTETSPSKAIKTIRQLRYDLVLKDHRIAKLEHELKRLRGLLHSLSTPLKATEDTAQQPRTSPHQHGS